MPKPKIRRPLPGPEYRYDAWGRIVKRKKRGSGSKWGWTGDHVDGNFAGNNQSAIYLDVDLHIAIQDKVTTEHVLRAKVLADASGNPKIFTSKEYSQDFLKSLIPGRM